MQLLPAASELREVSRQACAAEVLDALPPVMRFVRRHMRCHRNKGLSMPQFRTLALLAATRTASLTAVADFLGTSLPTASRIVSGLVEKGLVQRHECAQDRRRVDLAVTAKGTAIMESARSATRERLAGELASLDEADLRTIAKAMGMLKEVFARGMVQDAAGCEESGVGGDAGDGKARKAGRRANGSETREPAIRD